MKAVNGYPWKYEVGTSEDQSYVSFSGSQDTVLQPNAFGHQNLKMKMLQYDELLYPLSLINSIID